MADLHTFYEFFAGGGMARAGLGPGWSCLFANDFSEMKALAYRANWSADDLVCADISGITTADLPGTADLAWASFPCQDLSLAGNGGGLGDAAGKQTRSGAFWPFWNLMRGLVQRARGPRMIVLENVPGVLTSHGGRDFAALGSALSEAGYRFGAVVIDARHFVPQSRRRVFFVAVRQGGTIPGGLVCGAPHPLWHPEALVTARDGLPDGVRNDWLWWHLPVPAARKSVLVDVLEDESDSVSWHNQAETNYLLALMSPANLAKVERARRAGQLEVGCIYRRTRPNAEGVRRQRAEVRFDNIAGCLRTPGGGSSRQTILVVEGERVRSRLLSIREAARLMGLEESYRFPPRYNDAYHIAGDGVCVPVVRHLARYLLEPVLAANHVESRLIAAE